MDCVAEAAHGEDALHPDLRVRAGRLLAGRLDLRAHGRERSS